MFEIFGIPSQALFGQLLLGLINGSFYALLSLGLAVIFGMLNIINFAHGAQYMMGAFTAYILLQYLGVNYWVALIVTPIVIGTIVAITGSFYWGLMFIGAVAVLGAASYIFILGDIKRIELPEARGAGRVSGGSFE